jgi:hypothetical protein
MRWNEFSFGGIGYCIYSISLLVSEHAYVPGFNIFAGALLGECTVQCDVLLFVRECTTKSECRSMRWNEWGEIRASHSAESVTAFTPLVSWSPNMHMSPDSTFSPAP